MKNFEIKGLKKVAEATKAIDKGHYGFIIYNSESKTVFFEGLWVNWLSVQNAGLTSSERAYKVTNPMTMRGIKKMIAQDFDYDTYIEMCLEDDGVDFVKG